MNPRRVSSLLPIVAACILIFVAGVLPVLAQDGGGRKVFPNGHVVDGEFLIFYNSVVDPDKLFGQPITRVFPDPLNPRIEIQYFERVRMERDLSLPAGEQVSLADIGEYAYDPNSPGIEGPLTPNDPQCRVFSNGKLVCYSFLDFFTRYGEKYIGAPVTNVMLTADNRLVQYFQHVRMEWRGEMPQGQRVAITALGHSDFDKRIGNQRLRWPDPTGRSGTIGQIIPSLRAFTGRPLIINGDQQQVFVIIRDQFGRAIEGATVTVTFYYPEAGPQGWSIAGIKTNESGIAIADYTVKGVKPNDVVRVEVEAVVPSATEGSGRLTAGTWFRVWW